jgi:hypothetical protein
VSPRDAARALALGRIAIGAACVLAPRLAGSVWVGRDGGRPGASVFVRAVGARDVLLGAMVLHTVDHPEVAPRWLAATAACDAVDCAAATAVRDDIPGARGPAGIALAGGAAVAGAALSRTLAGRQHA